MPIFNKVFIHLVGISMSNVMNLVIVPYGLGTFGGIGILVPAVLRLMLYC